MAYITLLISLNPLESTELQITVSDDEVGLNVDLSSVGFAHYRVDGSVDLDEWEIISSLGLIDGQGGVTLSWEDSLPESMFFKLVEDDSASNVLNLSDTPDDYENISWPEHLVTDEVLATDNTPDDNPVTNEGALLGRVLFYDKKLSANYTMSCASCHQQENGFSDPDPLSTGFDGRLTGRNSMGLTNAQFYESGHFFWDERADALEDQVLEPIQNDVEMGLTLEEAVDRVASYDYYEQLFVDAFGDSAVTSERMALALAQFIRSIVSTQSKYDIGEASDFSNFTDEELLGMQLFNGRARCANCHAGPNFVGDRIENNGLEFPYVDEGVGAVTGRDRDLGKFKMSSLRNIEKTAPYMHDGRFTTLEEVVEHYDNGVVDNDNLGRALLDQNGVRQLNLSQEEKDALVAFMLTMTDDVVLTDSKWSDPFAEGAQ
ncbi:MAG: cytochrome c peroxidase [Verrucomicrobiota bacterium]